VKWSRGTALWLVAYLVTLLVVAGAVVRGRAVALAAYGTPEAQAQWDTWREDTKKMAKQPGVVKRREAKSTEPPALVLMRDHFTVCLSLALLLTTVLFATFMFFVRGALSAPTPYSRLPIPRD
jgi:heme A synthase